MLLPRSARSAKVPGNRAVGPYLAGPGPHRREAGAPGMLAARLPGNSTYDNPRYGQIRGCRGLPHSLTPFTGRPVRWPLLGRPGPVHPRTPGETPVARGAGGCRGFAYGGQPPVGPDPADAGGLPYPRNRFTSPGIKATPLTLLLDRIVRDDESGAEAALRIFRQFRQRGCMVVSVRESWLNGSPEVQDILIAFAGGMAERESARRSERIKAGLARRRAEGKAVGRQAARRTRASASGRATSGCGKRAARGGRAQVSGL